MKIGFIGLGIMGYAMASKLIENGYDLIVYDVNPRALDKTVQKGATQADSPDDVGSRTAVSFLSLPTPQTVMDVVNGSNGVLNGANSGHIIVDLSTTDPHTIQSLAINSHSKDVILLDAPISGGVIGAEKGTLAIMVGGDETAFHAVRPILSCLGKNIFYAGDSGKGASAKLVNNYLAAANMSVIAEGLVLGRKLGLDVNTLFEILSAGSGNSFQLQYRFKNHIASRNFEPGFSIDLMIKDLGLAIAAGEKAEVPMILGHVVKQLYEIASMKGLGGQDTSGIVNIMEEYGHVQI